MTLLLLAGTREAQLIAKSLAERGVAAIASLAGVTRSPTPLGLETRVGGFGGAEGFCQTVRDLGITAVLDATHPFAHEISNRTVRLCAQMAVPYCQLLRPAWVAGPADRWTEVECEEDVSPLVQPGQVVFLATGRQTLHRFENLSQAHVICRQIDPPDAPFPFKNGRYLIGRPPFSVEQEEKLFRELEVDWLVVKNAGGASSMSKLTAARQIGLPVAMIARPPQPDATRVDTVDGALAWVEGL